MLEPKPRKAGGGHFQGFAGALPPRLLCKSIKLSPGPGAQRYLAL